MQIDLIYYNDKGIVKSITFEDFKVVPVEPYFIKGLVLNGRYLNAFQVYKILQFSELSILEHHFLTARYGFFFELSKHNFRLENEPFKIIDFDKISI